MSMSPPVDAPGVRAAADDRPLDAALLRTWRLPLRAEADKRERGTVLVIGGSPTTTGAVALAGEAALRVGAGRLQIAVAETAADVLGVALPEALVTGLPVRPNGTIRPRRAARVVAHLVAGADAVLVGPGLWGDGATSEFLAALLPDIRNDAVAVIDAAALGHVVEPAPVFSSVAGRLALVANEQEVERAVRRLRVAASDAPGAAAHRAVGDEAHDLRALAAALRAVVACHGHVVAPDGRTWTTTQRSPGLGTSGSGDVLGGLVAGAAARCGNPLQAMCWATYLHAEVGARLSESVGAVGYVAREIAKGVPAVLHELSR